jgi:hypothetical protein
VLVTDGIDGRTGFSFVADGIGSSSFSKPCAFKRASISSGGQFKIRFLKLTFDLDGDFVRDGVVFQRRFLIFSDLKWKRREYGGMLSSVNGG